MSARPVSTVVEVTLEGEFAGLYGFEASGDYLRADNWEPDGLQNLAIGPVFKYDGREDLEGEVLDPIPVKLQEELMQIAADKLFERAEEAVSG
jgi:hypothetical protein